MKTSMNTMMNSKEHVRKILEESVKSRDEDARLFVIYWIDEIRSKGLDIDMPLVDFLRMFVKGDLTSTETISRVRRKLQEQEPHLRGEKYRQRHEEKDTITQNINNL
jgi:hypothetical protein